MVESQPIGSTSTVVGSRHLVFNEHTVVKYQGVERTRLELIKTQLGAEIGRTTSLFRTPAIVSHDLAAGSITFERFSGFINLKQALSASRLNARLIERVARTLAVIHNQLSLPDDYAIPLPDFGVEVQMRPVFVHGDFSAQNIFYRAEGDELVVIDWSVTDWLTDGNGTQGPRYVDLTILLQSLFASRPFGPNPIPDPASLGRIFLEAYCQECHHEVRMDEFDRYFYALLSLFRKQCREQMGWRFLAYKPSFWQVQQFVRKFCRDAAGVPDEHRRDDAGRAAQVNAALDSRNFDARDIDR